MPDPVEIIWTNTKRQALQFALADSELPDSAQCTEVVEKIVAEVLGSSDAVSREAREFYADELRAMTEDLRNRKRAGRTVR